MTLSANPIMDRRRWCVAVALLVLRALAASTSARAGAELNIPQGPIQPLPIAIADFAGDGSVDSQTAREISDVVANDLRASGLFIPIHQAAFLVKGLGPDSVP